MAAEQNDDLLTQDLGDADFDNAPPLPSPGRYRARSYAPRDRKGVSDKGPWAKLTIPFEILDDDEARRMAPRKPVATYGIGRKAHWLDVVEDASVAGGIRIATKADKEGANWQLKGLAKRMGIADGRIRALSELGDRECMVTVAHEARDSDPDVKDAVVTRVELAE